LYRLFSWEHSYFSGKVRAYLRYKDRLGGLGPGYEDILATQEIIQRVLIPATDTNVVPQLQAPDGTWIEDSSEIIDWCERKHPSPPVVPPADTAPRQRLLCYLIELLADEWMVVYAFWERWFYSLEGADPDQERYNAQQWGVIFNPTGSGEERRALARLIFDQGMSIKDPANAERGPYSGLVELGLTERTVHAWEESNTRLLEALEAHFDRHDFVLGGLPSLADFGLMGPLYAHLYRDAVPGFVMRSRFPLVAEWVERTNGTNALNARSYDQKLYDVGPEGELIPKPATSDGGAWLPDDEIPATLLPLLEVFFEEMWPVLDSSMHTLRRYLASGQHEPGALLPGKTFMATPGFEALQRGDGPLTLEFEIGGVRERRMVLPYQIWMLQRLADALRECVATEAGLESVETLVGQLAGADGLLHLDEKLRGCRVRKVKGLIFADS
jgi:glutathione S-transferase